MMNLCPKDVTGVVQMIGALKKSLLVIVVSALVCITVFMCTQEFYFFFVHSDEETVIKIGTGNRMPADFSEKDYHH